VTVTEELGKSRTRQSVEQTAAHRDRCLVNALINIARQLVALWPRPAVHEQEPRSPLSGALWWGRRELNPHALPGTRT
jgi:hypothetical protein